MSQMIREWITEQRRRKRDKKLFQMRQSRRNQLISFLSREQLITCFNRLKIDTLLSYQSIFEHCYRILYQPIFLIDELVDENHFVDIHIHTNFLRQISEYLKKCSKDSSIFNHLVRYIENIISKYTCQQIHTQPGYQWELHHIIGKMLEYISSNTLKNILKWVSNKESIQLSIKMSDYLEEIYVVDYPNIFQMIESCLRNEQSTWKDAALLLLTKVVKHAEKDEMFKMYEQYYNIVAIIIEYLDQKVNIHGTELDELWIVLASLFSTFDEALLKYATTGIISTCGKMIWSNSESNIFGALQLLFAFSKVKSEMMIELLILDEELHQSKMWLNAAINFRIFKHQNISIRRSFFQLLKNILRLTSSRQISIFCGRFINNNNSSILDVFGQALQTEESNLILFIILECIDRFLFNESAMDKSQLRLVVINLQQKNIISLIEKFSSHEWEKIRQIYWDIKERIDQIMSNPNIYQIL